MSRAAGAFVKEDLSSGLQRLPRPRAAAAGRGETSAFPLHAAPR